MSTFSDTVLPIVQQLKDDPNRGPPLVEEPTTFPIGSSGLEGELISEIADVDLVDEVVAPLLEPSERLRDDEDIQAGRSALRQVGLDILAFYKSFRFVDRPPFPSKWGIFLLDAGLDTLAVELSLIKPTLARGEAAQLATAILVAHERYHYWIDAWSLGQEVLPLTSGNIKRYEYYVAATQKITLTEDDIEESLANHYALRKLQRKTLTDGSNAAILVKPIFDACPVPYSDYQFDSAMRAKREGVLAAAICNSFDPASSFVALTLSGLVDAAGTVGVSIRPAPLNHPVVGRGGCPLHLVRVHRYAKLLKPFQGPTLKEMRLFFESYLAGTAEKSDHYYYVIDNGEKIRFPNPHDKEVRNYELTNILLKAGMTQREFFKAREATRYWTRNCPRADVRPSRKV